MDINKKFKIIDQKISELAQRVFQFSKETYKTDYIIMCEGNITTNTIIIAEAPGRNEAIQKRILIGRSGQIVRKYTTKHNVHDDFMFLNSVPWRPTNNRTPTITEMRSYLPFWKELFKILNIEYIVALGQVAERIAIEITKETPVKKIYAGPHPAKHMYTHKKEDLDGVYHILDQGISTIRVDMKMPIMNYVVVE